MSKDDGLSPTPIVSKSQELADNREDITRKREESRATNRGTPPREADPAFRPGGKLEQRVHEQVARDVAAERRKAADRERVNPAPSPEEKRDGRIAEFRKNMKAREVFNRVRNNDKDRGR